MTVPGLCGYCGGVLDSIISVFAQLHRSGWSLRPCLSQCDTWLLVYVREKPK